MLGVGVTEGGGCGGQRVQLPVFPIALFIYTSRLKDINSESVIVYTLQVPNQQYACKFSVHITLSVTWHLDQCYIYPYSYK